MAQFFHPVFIFDKVSANLSLPNRQKSTEMIAYLHRINRMNVNLNRLVQIIFLRAMETMPLTAP